VAPIAITPDLDAVVRTVWDEARGEGALGQQAVAAAIMNRSRRRCLTPREVVLQENQFSGWWNPKTRKAMEALDPNSPEYRAVLEAIAPVYAGRAADPTGGADHFYAPKVVAAPRWSKGRQGVDIGNHRYYELEKDGRQCSPASPAKR
jgi:conjugal transfer mating pair stabilization protein TraG